MGGMGGMGGLGGLGGGPFYYRCFRFTHFVDNNAMMQQVLLVLILS